LRLLKEKRVDVALVHAPEAERKAVAEGWAANRILFGSNEFYIVGPKDDPARISTAESAADAFARVARAKAKFLSRGDNSGTHKKEMSVWRMCGVEPSDDWYIVTGDFMLATLRKANEVQGYFMTDSSTWVASKKDLDKLAVLFRGDPMLVNVYHGLCRPKDGSPEQKHAEQFLRFLGTDKAQQVLRSFGVDRYGESMYHDAEYATRFDH
jgi:tungstate transport system substrate-binding protein